MPCIKKGDAKLISQWILTGFASELAIFLLQIEFFFAWKLTDFARNMSIFSSKFDVFCSNFCNFRLKLGDFSVKIGTFLAESAPVPEIKTKIESEVSHASPFTT